MATGLQQRRHMAWQTLEPAMSSAMLGKLSESRAVSRTVNGISQGLSRACSALVDQWLDSGLEAATALCDGSSAFIV